MISYFENILKSIIGYDDFLLLFSGFLITLSIYHFLLYFQHKDRVYLFYSFYTFLIFTSSYPRVETTILKDVLNNSSPHLNLVIIPREWTYNTLYMVFAKTLVEFHKYKPKWNKILNISIVIYFITLFLATVYAYFTGVYKIVGVLYSYFFSPTIPILAIISIYILSKMDTELKYYIITGSLVYMISAESAFYLFKDIQKSTVVFYTGVFIENILFSLALGAKQKRILEDKNTSQEKLIQQLKENEKLKQRITSQMQQDISRLNRQIKIDQIEKLKAKYDKELAELKIVSLRSQMNPHFIFNSLNSIKSYIIENEKENAVYYLNKFSKLIRKILATAHEKNISLSDELDTLQLYVDIENIRFNNEIDFSMAVDEELNKETIKVPALILQPFVENAIWHGLSLKKGLKRLDITIKKLKDTHIMITIEDNGIGRDRAENIKKKKLLKRRSIGISLTEERLKRFSDKLKNRYQIRITDLFKNDHPAGTKVVIKIPVC